MTEIRTEDVPRRRAPRGRHLYLRVLERLSPAGQDRLRSAATTVRRRKTGVRLFRERWIRRSRRSVRRSQRRWMRTLRRLQRSFLRALPRVRRRLRSLGSGMRHDRNADPGSPDVPILLRPRSALAQRLFPPTVALSGTGDVVLVNAVGRAIADVLARADAFGDRWIVVTDDPDVGVLRGADIMYEYLPADVEGGLSGRIRWFDYVYGIDSIVDIGAVPTRPTSRYETTEPRPS